MVKVKILSAVFISLLLLTATGCSNVVTSEEFMQTYQVRSGTIIEIINPNGSVTITGWDQNETEIKAVKESLRGREALDEIDINIDIADKLLIETVHPSANTVVSVDYEIKVPGDLLIGIIDCSNGNIILENVSGNPELTTSNGSINATRVNGIVKADSSNGNITATGVRGLAGLKTSNGNILAELPQLHENLEIKTSNGSISLLLSPSLSVDLDAKTSNGSISISNLNIDTALFERTHLSGEMNGGGLRITLETSNGSIELAPLR
ncbi:MAG: DUF4097 family beta strand repeat-containing protein [Bacillota bacterium]|nr:DUF4097 domain-containing protein [Bacillota bacterium]MDW7729273.1 DUF4097 family beta strand repeat-containing protein [Bacillota bacterium]